MSFCLKKEILKYSLFTSSIFLFAPTLAHAATLSITPTDKSGLYSVGQIFSIKILVNTSVNEPINAVSGIVSYSPAILELLSVDKAGSKVDFWIGEPAYSNAEGKVQFEGGMYNPGFTGLNGNIVTLLFKAKSKGSTLLSFPQASILANDGLGTNVLDSSGKLNLNIGAATETVVPVGQAITITSSTHPDQDKWYASKLVEMSWKVPSGTIALKADIDKDPSGSPSTIYNPPINSKEANLTSGTWYLHLQAEQAGGTWSKTSHFKIKIDADPPNPFQVKFPHGSSTTDPRPVILFNTTDNLSGIDYYDVSIRGASAVRVEHDIVESNPYAIPGQNIGYKDIKVIAYDKAGNSTLATTTFEIDSIEPPSFDDVPSEIEEGDILQLRGVTYPNSSLTIFLKNEDGSVSTQSMEIGSTGRFLAIWSKFLRHGSYILTAQVEDERGAKSSLSEEKTIKVDQSALLRFGWPLLNYITLLAIILLGLSALIVWVWYLTNGLRRIKKKIHFETENIDKEINTKFKKLYTVVVAQVKAMEKTSTKRELTAEEEKVIKILKDSLVETMEDIEDKVKNIEKII